MPHVLGFNWSLLNTQFQQKFGIITYRALGARHDLAYLLIDLYSFPIPLDSEFSCLRFKGGKFSGRSYIREHRYFSIELKVGLEGHRGGLSKACLRKFSLVINRPFPSIENRAPD